MPRPAGAFREWCVQQMRALSGSDDVTLCEFLLTVEANSEVAEYITMYLGESPAVGGRAVGMRRLGSVAAGALGAALCPSSGQRRACICRARQC